MKSGGLVKTLITGLLLVNLISVVNAEDRVIIKTENKLGQYAVKGEIISWTGDKLNVRLLPNGTLKSIDTSDVIRVETFRSQEYETALKLIAERKFKEAMPELNQALQLESRGWFKQEILAQILICEVNTNDYDSAVDTFIKLVILDPETRHLKLIPLPLFKKESRSIGAGKARSLMEQGENKYQHLLGAAFLMSDPEFTPLAVKKLEQLSFAGEPRLSFLAKVQLWRHNMDDNTPAGILELWQSILEFAPVELQTLGGVVLGDAYAKVGRVDQAVELWLRPWSEDYHNKVLVKELLSKSMQVLRDTGRKEDAVKLEKLISKE